MDSPVARWWAASVVAVVGLHMLTIRLSPVIWQDEVQIVDTGRVFLDPATSWGVRWDANDLPIRGASYLGSVVQELAYRMSGHSMWGPRLLGLAGAAFVAVTAFYWLSARMRPETAAAAASLILLIDPLFTENYRGARVDAWAIGCALWACGLLRRSRADGRGERRLALAGLLTGLLPSIWISSVLLVPLLAVEAVHAITEIADVGVSRGRALAWFVGSVALSVALTMLPLAGRLTHVAPQLLSIASVDLAGRGSFASVLGTNASTLAAILVRGPWLFVLGAAGLLLAGERRVLSALTLLLAFMLLTRLYQHRVVYLMPYLAAGFAELITVVAARWPGARAFRYAGLALTVVGAGGVSLGARSVLAFAEREGRNPDRLVALAARAGVPPGSRVYLGSWELYYAGRALNWRLYRLFTIGESCDNETFPTFLSTMDYAVFAAPSLPVGMDRCLARSGLRLASTIGDGQSGTPMRVLGRQWGATPYGGLLLYARASSQ